MLSIPIWQLYWCWKQLKKANKLPCGRAMSQTTTDKWAWMCRSVSSARTPGFRWWLSSLGRCRFSLQATWLISGYFWGRSLHIPTSSGSVELFKSISLVPLSSKHSWIWWGGKVRKLADNWQEHKFLLFWEPPGNPSSFKYLTLTPETLPHPLHGPVYPAFPE